MGAVAPKERKYSVFKVVVTVLRAGTLKDHCTVSGGGKKFFSSPNCSDRLWDPPRLLFSSYRCPLSFAVKRPGA